MQRPSTLSGWLAWQQTLHPSAIDLGLTRIRRALDRLNWRAPDCPVITVGGTNGKGSSVAMLSEILGQAGYRVGTFTSPHLLRYNERIIIAGREVSDASLVAAFERIDVARGDDTLTFFEFNALAALLIFETAGLDAVILEVGLGGRLDAVNVVDADVALVVSIALDHCDWLGKDVEAIAREKAGIFRAGRPAIFGSTAMPESIAAVASAAGAHLLRQGREFGYQRSGSQWHWRGRAMQLEDLPMPALIGDIQLDNASAVLAVLESLASRLPVSRDAIERGLRRARVTGRFQIVHDRVDWILDVAHNPAAAQALAEQLAQRRGAGRSIAICGILADKDIDGIADALAASFDGWIVAGLSGDRAMAPAPLAQRLARTGIEVIATAPTVAAACEEAERTVQPGDTLVIFGSFLAVAPGLEWLRDRGILRD
jgi:dihydrofolate synthase/folylpolyglutamate synthase